MKLELLIGAAAVGLGATFVMDLWAIFLKHAFKIPSPNYCLVGRWLRHMTNGSIKHPSITAAAPKPAECTTGWIAHYIIGVLFALTLVALATPEWLQSPTLMPALIFGVVTVGFPFFIMHPSFGLGLAASKAPNPMQARLRSLMNHAAFGVGLYVSALVMSSITGVVAAGLPYDEAANAKADVERALAMASTTKRSVLVIFGANWCEDCRALDASLKNTRNAELVAKEFVVVKVDVGNFDRNLGLAAQYGNPIKTGIPAAVVLSPGNQVLYATRAGELANARRMSETGVYDFFRSMISSAKAKK